MVASNKEKYNSIISFLKERVEQDQQEVENHSEEVTRLDAYDSQMLLSFYIKLFELEQWDDKFSGNYCFKDRVIKINRYIDKLTLLKEKPELITICGLFMETEVCLIPMRFVKFIGTGNNRTALLPVDPVSVGLPSHDEVAYNTFRECTGTYGVCLSKRKNSWLHDFVKTSKSWEYVKVD